MTPAPYIDDPEPNTLVDTLRQVAGIISSSLDLQEVLQQVLEQVHTIIPYDMANIMLLDGDIARVQISKGYQDPQAVERIRFDVREVQNMRQMAETLQPIVVPDTTTDPNWVRVPPTENVRSWASAPLVVRDRVIGFLSLDAVTPGYYGPQHAATLAAFAPQAAIAIENARLYQGVQRRAAQLRTINEIGRHLTTVLDPQELFQRAVSLIRETYHHYTVSICVLEEGELRLAAMDAGPDVPRVSPGYVLERSKGIIWWVVEHGEPLLVPNVNVEPRFSYYEGFPLTVSELAVPIHLEGNSLGVLDVQSDKPNAYDQGDVDLLTILADQLAVAIRTAKLYGQERTGHRVAETLRRTSAVLGSTLDQQELLGLILEQLLEVIHYDSCSVLLREDDALRIVAAQGLPGGNEALGHSHKLQEAGLGDQVMSTRKPLVLTDVQGNPDWVYSPFGEHVRAWIGAPLIVKDKAIGLLCVDNCQPGAYTEEDARLVTAFANHAAIALENTRLYEEVRHRAVQLHAINEIGRDLALGLDPQDLFQNAVSLIRETYHHYAANIYLLEESELRLAATAKAPGTPWTEPVHVLDGDKGIIRWAFDHGEPLLVPDVSADPRYLFWDGLPDTASELAVPIRLEGRVLGVLDVESDRLNAYDQNDLELLTILADQLAVAIRTARLYQQERAGRLVAETLRRTSAVLGSTLDQQELLGLILEELSQVIDYDSCSVLLQEDDLLRVVAVRGWPEGEDALGHTFNLEEANLSAQVLENREPLVIADVHGDRGWARPGFGEHIRAWIGAPLIAKDRAIGLLCVDNCKSGAYTEEDARLVMAFANHAAIAMENARLYEDTQRRMEEIAQLTKASQAVISSLDLEDVLTKIVSLARKVANSAATSVVLVEDGKLGSSFEDFQGVPSLHARIRPHGSTRRIITTGEPVVINEILGDGSTKPPIAGDEGLIKANPVIVEAGIKSFASLPIISKGKVLGVLLCHSLNAYAFRGRLPLLTAFANHAAIAIENAHLYEASQRRLRQLTALQEVSVEVGDSLDLPTVLDAIAGSALRLVDADDVHIFLYDDERDELQFGTGMLQGGKPLEVPLAIPRPDGVTYTIARTGQPLFINDPRHHPLYGPEQAASWGLEAIVGLPLKHGSRVLGVINIACTRPHTFTPDEIGVLELLAGRAAVAIENAQLVERLRHTEKQTRDLNEELRQRLKELQQAQTRLVQSEKLAAVGQLVSGVAHELNNPLTTVIGYTQLMLQDGNLPDELHQDAQRIYDAAARCAEIVRNLLTFSRQRKPRRILTNVNDAIDEALSLRRNQLRVEGIELVCDLDPALPLIMADSFRLQEVILNLVINSEQAMLETQGSGRLVIRSRQGPDVVRIEVEDTGPGIPEDVLPRIFEPFFTTKEVGQGTGLGLSICYGIIEEHGGRIWAESRQGTEDHGTTFIVELPVGEEESAVSDLC